jgi:hypothetical protein
MSGTENNPLIWLQHWYSRQANADWEHRFGVRIVTLDNPGWIVEIDLNQTSLEGKNFEKIERDSGEDDWITCRVRDGKFEAFCDPTKLVEALQIFRGWVEQNENLSN